MSSLMGSERVKLEKLLGMSSDFVLNFSNHIFGEFFDGYDIDIYSYRYKVNGVSKTKLMRSFWKLDNDYIVVKILNEMIEYAAEYAADEQCFGDSNPFLIEKLQEIIKEKDRKTRNMLMPVTFHAMKIPYTSKVLAHLDKFFQRLKIYICHFPLSLDRLKLNDHV